MVTGRTSPVTYFFTPNIFSMNLSAAIAGGLAGTLTVASLHEALRRITTDAPRMDLLDRELLRKGFTLVHKNGPPADELQRWAVGGELVCDTAYYSLAGIGGSKSTWFRGAVLGLIAGVTAVLLPKPFGLPPEHSSKTAATRVMTIGLYLAGGLVAAAVAKLVDNNQLYREDEAEELRLAMAYH